MPRKKRGVAGEDTTNVTSVVNRYKTISALNIEQKEFIRACHVNDILFLLSAAGVGKSYLSAGMAAEYLNRKLVDRLIITRSSLQADEIGFIKGDHEEKMFPLLTQVLVDLGEFLNVKKEIDQGRIEILSLAFARGRSFRNSFVILEEAQNCDYRQLKMFITRIGEDSKLIINGDLTQSDLDKKTARDFPRFIQQISTIANEENKIRIIELTKSVRHPIIDVILSVLD